MVGEHPLESCFHRVNRAMFHIGELEGILESLSQTQKKIIIANQKSNTVNLSPHQSVDTLYSNEKLAIPVPIDVPIIIGETVYNLRSALDFLVFVLAWADSGKRQEGTQFLIEDVFSDPADKKRGF